MNKSEIAKCVLAAFVFVPAVFFIVMNWVIFFHNLKNRRDSIDRRSSWIPLCGGLMGVVSAAIVPIPELKRLWWILLIADYGCIIGFAETAFYWSKYNRQQNRLRQKP